MATRNNIADLHGSAQLYQHPLSANRRGRRLLVLSILVALVLLPGVLATMLDTKAISHASPTLGTQAPATPVPGNWLIDTTCQNPGSGNILLRAVAVDPSGGTWSVGEYYPTGSIYSQVIVFNEPHSGGCVTYTPFTDPNGSHLYGVAAISSTEVWVVGDYGFTCGDILNIPNGGCFGQPLALHFVSGGWGVVHAQNLSSDSKLQAVGVDASNNVFAVGQYTVPVGYPWNGLIEKYNPISNQFEDADPGAVRGCSGGYSAVTFSTWNSTNYVWVTGCTYVLRWDYTASNFTDTSVPLPIGGGTLYGISADPNGEIRAVGGSNGGYPLFERYDLTGQEGGPGWLPPYVDTSQAGTLYGISSVSTDSNFPWITDVWAVGVSTDQHSIIYHDDGNFNNPPNVPWNSVPSLPNGGNVGNLISIATKQQYSNPHGGFSESDVWLVGSYNNGGVVNTRQLEYLPIITASPPKNTTSRYVEVTVEPTMQALGCSQRANGESGIIVLDYGAPRNWSAATPGATPTYGTELTHLKPTISLNQIQDLTVAFADGYAAPTCAPATPIPNQTAIIVIGTNNDIEDATHVALNNEDGSTWGQLVNNVQATAIAKGYGALERFAGGMDIEQNPPSVWGNPTQVTDWYDGYLGASNKAIYNYGSCDGCNPVDGLPSDWTPQDVYKLSWSISLQAQALPENYYYGKNNGCLVCHFPYAAPMAEQWRRISAYAYPSYTSIGFSGAMSEDYPTDSNSPKDAWTQLWQAMNFDPTVRTAHDLSYSTQITESH